MAYKMSIKTESLGYKVVHRSDVRKCRDVAEYILRVEWFAGDVITPAGYGGLIKTGRRW
jgi:hypothetical protein